MAVGLWRDVERVWSCDARLKEEIRGEEGRGGGGGGRRGEDKGEKERESCKISHIGLPIYVHLIWILLFLDLKVRLHDETEMARIGSIGQYLEAHIPFCNAQLDPKQTKT